MYRKLSRLVLVASVATGLGLVPMLGAQAGQRRGVDVYNMPKGFDTGTDTPNQSQIEIGDTVVWYIMDGEHTITPADKKTWDGEDSKTVKPGEEYAVVFPKAGKFAYYCEIHGTRDDKGNVNGMSGLIVVRDPNAPPATTPPTTPPSTDPPTTQPPTTATTRPPTPQTTTPPGVGGAGVHAPTTAAPAPTTTTGAKAKGKKPKDDETTTTTTAPPPPPAPIDLPDSAIIPNLPGFDTPTSVQEGVVSDAPEGEAVALLKGKRSGNGMKLLIASGIGLGALGLGTAGYKFANRSSKYFPA